jgi:hypothetical protein
MAVYLKTKEDLKQYALRALGHPKIEVNITDEQMEDRLNEAIFAYTDGHMDGSYITFIKVPVTQEDINDQSLTIKDPNICDVIRIVGIDYTTNTTDDRLFDANYYMGAMVTNAMTSSGSLNQQSNQYGSVSGLEGVSTTYNIMSSYFQDLQNLMDTKPSYTFNRNTSKMRLVADWSKIPVGSVFALETSLYVDPNENPDTTGFWDDGWLKSYTIALFQMQWGRNLMLFNQYQLPGGLVLDGKDIEQRAIERALSLKEQLSKSYARPLGFLVG